MDFVQQTHAYTMDQQHHETYFKIKTPLNTSWLGIISLVSWKIVSSIIKIVYSCEIYVRMIRNSLIQSIFCSKSSAWEGHRWKHDFWFKSIITHYIGLTAQQINKSYHLISRKGMLSNRSNVIWINRFDQMALVKL